MAQHLLQTFHGSCLSLHGYIPLKLQSWEITELGGGLVNQAASRDYQSLPRMVPSTVLEVCS